MTAAHASFSWKRVDFFVILLLAAVALAAAIPLNSAALSGASLASTIAVCVLFFLHGSRLSVKAMIGGIRRWPVHLLVIASSFVIFPLLGFACELLVPWAIPHELWIAVFFLCTLPSTIQSSIAFVSIAGGDVPAAVFSATLSNLLGIVVTPLLAMLVLGTSDVVSGQGLLSVGGELLLPFVVGLAAHPLLGRFLDRHPRTTTIADRGSVLILVFSAFAASVGDGLWTALPLSSVIVAAVVDVALLAAVLGLTSLLSWGSRLERGDRIVVILCGSKKGLAAGVAMASVLFSPPLAGIVVIPLMMYHLLQLLVCAPLARRWGRSHAAVTTAVGGPTPSLQDANPRGIIAP